MRLAQLGGGLLGHPRYHDMRRTGFDHDKLGFLLPALPVEVEEVSDE